MKTKACALLLFVVTVALGQPAADDSQIIQAAVDSGNQVFLPARVYNLTRPIFLHSNSDVRGTFNTVLHKAKSMAEMLVSRACGTDGSVWDTNITVANLAFDIGATNDATSTISPTSNGNLGFRYVRGLRLENLSLKNGGNFNYLVFLQSVQDAVLDGIDGQGQKDGIHIGGGCSNIVVQNFRLNTWDDTLAICVEDYPRTECNALDSADIVFRNGISHSQSPTSGNLLRLITGSWTNWQSGFTYNIGNLCLVTNRIYKMANSGPLVGTNVPVHLFGDAVGNDGIVWRFMNYGTNYTVNIHRVRLENVVALDGRKVKRETITVVPIGSFIYDNGETEGTQNTSVMGGLDLVNIGSAPYQLLGTGGITLGVRWIYTTTPL